MPFEEIALSLEGTIYVVNLTRNPDEFYVKAVDGSSITVSSTTAAKLFGAERAWLFLERLYDVAHVEEQSQHWADELVSAGEIVGLSALNSLLGKTAGLVLGAYLLPGSAAFGAAETWLSESAQLGTKFGILALAARGIQDAGLLIGQAFSSYTMLKQSDLSGAALSFTQVESAINSTLIGLHSGDAFSKVITELSDLNGSVTGDLITFAKGLAGGVANSIAGLVGGDQADDIKFTNSIANVVSEIELLQDTLDYVRSLVGSDISKYQLLTYWGLVQSQSALLSSASVDEALPAEQFVPSHYEGLGLTIVPSASDPVFIDNAVPSTTTIDATGETANIAAALFTYDHTFHVIIDTHSVVEVFNVLNINVFGGSGNDHFEGTTGNDLLSGGAGEDYLRGNGGTNVLLGGNGHDYLRDDGVGSTLNGGADDDLIFAFGSSSLIDGGSGPDRLYLSRSGLIDPVTLSLTPGSSSAMTLPDGTSIRNVEFFNLTTGSGDDRITFNELRSGDRIYFNEPPFEFDPDLGPNYWDAGAGNDTATIDLSAYANVNVSYSPFSRGFTIDDGLTRLLVLSDVENINLYGGLGNDYLDGGAGTDTLLGDEGNDTLISRGFGSTLSGGAGEDNLHDWGSGSILDGGTGADYLDLQRSSLTTLILTPGSPTANVLPDGTSFRNFETFALTTGAGDDTVTFNQPIYHNFYGSNSWDGAGGNDTAIVDFSGNSRWVSASYYLSSGTGYYRLYAEGQSQYPTLVLSNVENIRIYGGSASDSLIGGVGSDIMSGGPGNDYLSGGGGKDTFEYADGGGADLIADFSHAEGDQIDLTGVAGVYGLSDIVARATQVGNITVINFGSGNTIQIDDAHADELVQGDFIMGIAPLLPEIAVSGIGQNIADGDTTPGSTDGTDFGTVLQGTTVDHVFTVSNTGTATLTASLGDGSGAGAVLEPVFSDAGDGNVYISAVNVISGGGSYSTPQVHFSLVDFFPYVFDATVVAGAITAVSVTGSYSFDPVLQSLASLVLTGSLPAGFSLVDGLSASIAAGDSDTFTVRLDTSTVGTKSGQISFTTNDSDESPFDFSITGTVTGLPEIAVTAGAQSIVDGDTTPTTDNGRDFGSVLQGGGVIHTFTVSNIGRAPLTTSDLVLPTGFSLIEGLSGTIFPGGFDDFSVRLDGATPGTKSGEISFTTNDSDKNPFNFAITGTVNPLPPEISVSGADVNIAASDMTPGIVDGTDFGSIAQGTTAARVFTVSNLGAGPLNTYGLALPPGFSLVEELSTSIAPGTSDAFTVQLDGGTVGTKTGQIGFFTNDVDKSVFVFSITGTVTEFPMPEIAVIGSGVEILDGDMMPSSSDGTDFGPVLQDVLDSHDFTIVNLGSAPLTTSGLSLPAGFSLVEGLSPSIAPGGSDTFTVQLDASTPGLKSGQISFAANDGGENPFNFSIAGIVTTTAPESVPYFITDLRNQNDFGSAYRNYWNVSDGVHLSVTYSFMSSVPSNEGIPNAVYGGNPFETFQPFDDALKTAARAALDAWQEVSGITFVEIPAQDEALGQRGMIEFGRHAMTEAAGYAYFPQTNSGVPIGGSPIGDVFIDSKLTMPPYDLSYLLEHEIGHALGLKHPAEGPNILPVSEDNRANTIMSLAGPAQFNQPLEIFDIAAIQQIYGVNGSARSGDDTYAFDAQHYVWDGAGIDTLTAQGTGSAVHLDLEPGTWSFQGAAPNSSILAPGQLFIGFGSSIENAVGSNSGDTISGNAQPNRLRGLDGNDTLSGGGGDDTLEGGAGNDALDGGTGVDCASYATAAVAVTVNLLDPAQNTSDASGDTYLSIENIIGTDHDGDVLTGDTGANVIEGLDGYNTLDGGAGSDTLIGGAGPNFIFGGYGDDTVNGGSGVNSVFGFLGNDTLNGGDNGNTMNGEDGNDTLNGGAGIDYLIGGAGNDILDGSGSGDALFGDDPSNPAVGGNDTLNGGDGDDGLDGGTADDVLHGGKGVDWLYGQAGNDQFDGGDDTDALFGGDGNDVLIGGAGGDSVDGGDGDDQQFGDDGVDWLFGQADTDTLDGGNGGDVLFAGDGNDVLTGGADGDSLDGGPGDDVLDGGPGIDVLFGSTGADTFIFAQPSQGGDVVRDFNAAEGDTVAIDHNGFGLSATLVGQSLPDAMLESGSGLPAIFLANGPVFYLETQNHGLWFDPTGGASNDVAIVAGFEAGVPTSVNDMIVF